MLCLSVDNSQPPTRSVPSAQSSGLGLDNLRRRLSLLYPGDAHSLDISKTDTAYSATLCLKPIQTV